MLDEILKCYRDTKLDINKQDRQGYTPCHHAAYSSGDVLMRILNYEGVNVMARNQDLNTPLHFFCARFSSPNCQEPFNKMLELGADVNAVNKFGETPLHKSCFNDSVRILLINLLCKAGADPNIVNFNGEGALHFAVRLNRQDLVFLLLQAGADQTMKGKEGKTPYDLAVQSKREQIAQCLKKVEDLAAWLKSVDQSIFTNYYRKFLSEGVFLNIMPLLDNSLLTTMGIDNVARATLLNAAKQLTTAKSPASVIEHSPQRPRCATAPKQFPAKSGSASNLAKGSSSVAAAGLGAWAIELSEIEFTTSLTTGKLNSGKVFKAIFRGMEVAVKVLKPLQDEDEQQQFKKELEIMSILQCPNIVKIHGASMEPQACLIMEYCARDTLYEVLRGNNAIGWDKTFKFAIQVRTLVRKHTQRSEDGQRSELPAQLQAVHPSPRHQKPHHFGHQQLGLQNSRLWPQSLQHR
eukprot:TRINITY_DN12164_c0_g1_i2.p1 TRINITY_DN12164_c0_g1~~TRINITY_DN12164_c0_g1_i2.p1  ORF type:complete len:523 (+),score=104.77 TRINITY_DN12164_c0_g1_i2:180-1571(+)